MGEALESFSNIVFNLLIESVDDDIKEAQTHITNKNYGENPTHTQLGKDATDHPLNGLAAKLAELAVKDVGYRIKNIWDGKISDPNGNKIVDYVLNTYFRHPRDVNWMEEDILKWVGRNKTKLEKLCEPTIATHTHKIAKREISKWLNKIKEIKKYFSK